MSACDSVWEEDIYSQGRHLNRWPFDIVVSFIFRHHPRDKPREQVRILEVGCAAGNNLWFAAREGFSVAGIDGSTSAIQHARQRFAEEGLSADLRIGDFTALPFEDASFDLVIDRGSLTCVGRTARLQAIQEVHRVLVENGRFLSNTYSATHTSAQSGVAGDDGITRNITAGTLIGVGGIGFATREDIMAQFQHGWKLLSVEHLEIHQELPAPSVHSEWRVIAVPTRS